MILLAWVFGALAVATAYESTTPARRLAGLRSADQVSRQRKPARQPRRRPSFDLSTTAARRVLALSCGLAVAVVTGSVVGAIAGLLIALVLPRLVARLPGPRTSEDAARIAADLPFTLDLVAACLAAGAPVTSAMGSVATHLRGPLSGLLNDVVSQLRLGAEAATAWRRAAAEPALQPLVETVLRVGDSGAALAPALRRLAEEQRERLRLDQEAAARRVGVLVVVPLGACFLPAFMLVGVVPIIAGLVGRLLV